MTVSHSCFVSQVRLEFACIQHMSFLSMWPSCYICDVYGVNFRDTVHLRVLAEGLNHLSAFAGSLEEFSRSSENCPEEMELKN